MPARLRITGIVGFAERIRRELAGAPLTADHRNRLRERVDNHLREVHDILRAHRARVEHLPPPSQRAYRVLAGIEWDEMPVAEHEMRSEVPARQASSTISWRGLSGFIDRTLDLLATDVPESQLEPIRQSIERTSRQIELSIQRQRLGPNRLTAVTRQQRGWLAFFAQGDPFRAYVAARRSASAVIDPVFVSHFKRFPPPLKIHFRPITGIFKLRATRNNGSILSLPAPMVTFDRASFEDLAASIFGNRAEVREKVVSHMTSESCQAVRAELDALGGIVENTRGAVHDLAESFDRMNAEYFNGTMARPHLTWNRTFTGRKFGHYDWIADTVMVTRTLDAPDVPQFVVDFIMYHELLHKFHGLHWVNGRGYAHTAEFLHDERKFARYAEAEAFLHKLARQIR